MNSVNTVPNGSWQYWVIVEPEPRGQFTAQAVGIPELRATAGSREEALEQIRTLISEWLASGRMVSIQVPEGNPLLRFQGHFDPSDPLEQEFVAESDRLHREDLEQTLQE
jgi:hypothetical protein